MEWKHFWRVLPFLVIAYIVFDFLILSSSHHFFQSVIVGLIMGLILIILQIIMVTIRDWQNK